MGAGVGKVFEMAESPSTDSILVMEMHVAKELTLLQWPGRNRYSQTDFNKALQAFVTAFKAIDQARREAGNTQ